MLIKKAQALVLKSILKRMFYEAMNHLLQNFEDRHVAKYPIARWRIVGHKKPKVYIYIRKNLVLSISPLKTLLITTICMASVGVKGA